MKLRTLALLIASTLAVASHAVRAENLLQVYQQAKGYDAQFKAQETQHLATLEKKQQALAGLKPQLNAGASADYGLGFRTEPSNRTGDLNAGYNLNLSKSLYNKPLDASISQLDAVIAQSRVGLEAKRQDLIMRVANAYFAVLTAQDNVAFAQTEKAAIGRQLEQAQAFFDAGRSAITDVKEAEASYAAAASQEITALQQLDISREGLRVLTGGFYQGLNTVRSDIPLSMPAPNNIESWVNLARQNSYVLKAGQQGLLASQRAVQVERAAKRPTVGIYAKHSGSYLDGENYDYFNTGASVGVQANVNLYDGGAIDSKVREAQHNFHQAQQEYTLQDRQIEQQVRSAFLTIQSSIGQIQANRQALSAAETAAEATQAGFEVGTRTAVDVLTSLRTVFSARRNYAASRYTLLLNTLTLRQAAGTLNEKDLASLSSYLTAAPSVAKTISPAKIDKDEPAVDIASSEALPETAELGDGYDYYAGSSASAESDAEDKPPVLKPSTKSTTKPSADTTKSNIKDVEDTTPQEGVDSAKSSLKEDLKVVTSPAATVKEGVDAAKTKAQTVVETAEALADQSKTVIKK